MVNRLHAVHGGIHMARELGLELVDAAFEGLAMFPFCGGQQVQVQVHGMSRDCARGARAGGGKGY